MSGDDVWLIDGTLEPIDFDGFADDRSPLELTEKIISRFSKPGDWVLDPFAGLGSSLIAAAKLGRCAVGFEPNPERAEFVASRIAPPNQMIAAPIQAITGYDLPLFDLIVTSPPYVMVNLQDDPWGPSYFEDMQAIVTELALHLSPAGTVVVEVSNISTKDGFRPLVAEFGSGLRNVFGQTGEICRVNTGGWSAGPGTHHSSLLIFEQRRPD